MGILHGTENGLLRAPMTEELWSQFSTRLRAFFRSRVRRPEDAEDLLHDTFARIHGHIGELRARDRLGPWLFAIARNALQDFHRKRRPGAPLDADLAETKVESRELNRLVGAWLGEFMAELPVEYRSVLAASELEGVTQREIAAKAGRSVSAIKSRVQRGRRMLMDRLLQCCHIDFDRRGNVLGYRRRAGCGCAERKSCT